MGDNLNTLQSLFPSRPRSELAKYLSASSDDLSRAFAAVERNALARPAKRARTTGPGGLENWLGKKGKGGKEVEEISLVSSDEEEKDAKPLQPPSTSTKPQRPILDAYSLLKPSVQSVSASSTSTAASTAPAPAIVNLPPLRLTTPAMIAQHTHGLVTLVENALPTELAGRLYVKMVAESEGKGTEEYAGQPWMPNKWFLVDREVTSPHTSSFYRESPASLSSTGGGYDQAAFDEAAQYWYNGVPRPSRLFTSDMDEARELVGEFVRTLQEGRERHPLEWQGEGGWRPNVAAVNCYRGKDESVGFHSDVLQYLGPQATIASLTLGVSRPFRLRPFIPSTPSSSSSSFSAPHPLPTVPLRTLEIPLPHNSLLIMHGGNQETFKHCVPPMGAMDRFRLPKGSLEGWEEGEEGEREKLREKKWNERINMTFRFYRPDFAPRSALSPPSYLGTPICPCGTPCTLRPDGRGRLRAKLSSHTASVSSSSSDAAAAPPSKEDEEQRIARYGGDEMAYFWTCNAGAQKEGKTCGLWRMMDMKKEGRGKWFVPSPSTSAVGTKAGLEEGDEGAGEVKGKGKEER